VSGEDREGGLRKAAFARLKTSIADMKPLYRSGKSIREFKLRYWSFQLPVPVAFRSSPKVLPRRIANFGQQALALKPFGIIGKKC
jgi:hypothetical protein